MITTVLLILAFIAFVLAVLKVLGDRFDCCRLIALGLALWLLSQLLPLLGAK